VNDSRPMAVEFQVEVPSDVEAGVPSDFANIWHTRTSFVLDFAVPKGPAQVIESAGNAAPRTIVPARVVARVRIPPEQAFEIARALTQQLDQWEKETGKRPPSSPTDTRI
jgi:Protein of unknown function (DUF3467)